MAMPLKLFKILLILLIWATSSIGAQETRPYITTKDVKVRSGPGTQYKVVAEIKSGTKVNVVGMERGWLRIVSKTGKPPGYIDELSARPLGEPVREAVASIQGVYTTTADTYVREGPGLHYKVVAEVSKNTKIHVVSAEGDWLKVVSKHGRPPGYVEKRFAERRRDK